MVLEWSPIEGAKSYKVFYDEESILNPKAPEPILESASTENTTMKIEKMMEWTEYYLVVRGFDDAGTRVGDTIPLHASTLRSPFFTLKESKTLDDQTISLIFSRPIDIKNTQIEIVNTETKKPRATKEIILSSEDLRIIEIRLEGKMAPDMSHDIVLKKVVDISGMEMSPESKKTTAIIFSLGNKQAEPMQEVVKEATPVVIPAPTPEVTIPVPVPPVMETKMEIPKDIAKAVEVMKPVEVVPPPDAALDDLQKKTSELGIERVEASIPLESSEPENTPVAIDKLPQTGSSNFILLGIALLFWVGLSYKKRTSL